MISDVPLGAFLSGGIDSSSIVAIMAKSSPFPIKTFSIGFKEEKYNELAYARTIAKMYNTDHHEMIVEPESIDLLPMLVHAYDEPFADSSAIPTYMVSKFAREYVTVILSGDGGDEIFSGYNSYRKMASMQKTMLSNSCAFRSLFTHVNRIMPDYLYGKGFTYYLSKNKNHLGAYFCIWKDYERYKLLNRNFIGSLCNFEKPENYKIALLPDQEWEFLSRMQFLDIKTYLVDDILTKVDRVSMLNSLEVRVPLLDYKLAELSFRIPARLKMKNNKQKYIFKKAMQPFLPPEIMNRGKQGFEIPLDYWFRDNLKDYAHEVLVNSKHLQDYLDMRYVQQLLDHHQKGMRDFSDKIWSLLFLNEWIRQNT
jgi:asparagine synthase (glutamine-hydrolysing)